MSLPPAVPVYNHLFMSTGDVFNQKPCFLRLGHPSFKSDSDINFKREMDAPAGIVVHVHSPMGPLAFALLAGVGHIFKCTGLFANRSQCMSTKYSLSRTLIKTPTFPLPQWLFSVEQALQNMRRVKSKQLCLPGVAQWFSIIPCTRRSRHIPGLWARSQ